MPDAYRKTLQQQILHLLLRKGARMAEPGEFTLRAFLNGKLDLSQAEGGDRSRQTMLRHNFMAMQQMRGAS